MVMMLALLLFDTLTVFTSFTVSSLESWGTAAYPRRGAVAPVHALWVAERGLTVLPHVALRALTDLLVVAPAPICALFIALWVRIYNLYFTKVFKNITLSYFFVSTLCAI